MGWRIVGAFWLLPVAIPVWLFFILPAWALNLLWFRGVHWDRLAVEFRVCAPPGPIGDWWFKRWQPWTGLSLPFAILISSSKDHKRTKAHELRHCDQWLLLGPLFPIVYVALLACFGYYDNPLEKDARAHEGD